jgi:hypothetical protein
MLWPPPHGLATAKHRVRDAGRCAPQSKPRKEQPEYSKSMNCTIHLLFAGADSGSEGQGSPMAMMLPLRRSLWLKTVGEHTQAQSSCVAAAARRMLEKSRAVCFSWSASDSNVSGAAMSSLHTVALLMDEPAKYSTDKSCIFRDYACTPPPYRSPRMAEVANG